MQLQTGQPPTTGVSTQFNGQTTWMQKIGDGLGLHQPSIGSGIMQYGGLSRQAGLGIHDAEGTGMGVGIGLGKGTTLGCGQHCQLQLLLRLLNQRFHQGRFAVFVKVLLGQTSVAWLCAGQMILVATSAARLSGEPVLLLASQKSKGKTRKVNRMTSQRFKVF